MPKQALIAGSTGLIGGHLLSILLDDENYDTVISISRRTTVIAHDKLREVICSFDKMDEVADQLVAHDLFICLGSNMKKAGSKEAFELFDYTYPLQLSKIALKNGVQQVSLVSALGANNSSLFFYNRVKGDLEMAISELQFETVNILRPSILLGEREETRVKENMAQGFYKALGWVFVGPIKKYKAIDGETVAMAMNKIARSNTPGINIFDSEEIETIV